MEHTAPHAHEIVQALIEQSRSNGARLQALKDFIVGPADSKPTGVPASYHPEGLLGKMEHLGHTIITQTELIASLQDYIGTPKCGPTTRSGSDAQCEAPSLRRGF